MITRNQYDKAMLIVEKYILQLKESVILQPNENPFLQKSIDELDITVRAFNCLKAAEVYFVRDLVNYSYADLRRFRGMGDRSLKEIDAILKYNGIILDRR